MYRLVSGARSESANGSLTGPMMAEELAMVCVCVYMVECEDCVWIGVVLGCLIMFCCVICVCNCVSVCMSLSLSRCFSRDRLAVFSSSASSSSSSSSSSSCVVLEIS